MTTSTLTRVALACGAALAVGLSFGTDTAQAGNRHFTGGFRGEDRTWVRGEDRTFARGEDRTFVRTANGVRSIDNDRYRCQRRDRNVRAVVRGENHTAYRGENCSFVN